MQDLNEQKKILREQIRQYKRKCSQEELNNWSNSIYGQLLNCEEVRKANTIFLYYSMPDEVDTHKIVRHLFLQGKTILLPKVIDKRHLELIPFCGEECLMESGPYHILEPIGPPFKNYDEIKLAIVPGVAFDADGNRLGHGRAYYDRQLNLMPDAYKIGICFSFQMVEKVPVSDHDIAMDRIIHDRL